RAKLLAILVCRPDEDLHCRLIAAREQTQHPLIVFLRGLCYPTLDCEVGSKLKVAGRRQNSVGVRFIGNTGNDGVNDRLCPLPAWFNLSQPIRCAQQEQSSRRHASSTRHLFSDIDLFIAIDSCQERRDRPSTLRVEHAVLSEKIAARSREFQSLSGSRSAPMEISDVNSDLRRISERTDLLTCRRIDSRRIVTVIKLGRQHSEFERFLL